MGKKCSACGIKTSEKNRVEIHKDGTVYGVHIDCYLKAKGVHK